MRPVIVVALLAIAAAATAPCFAQEMDLMQFADRNGDGKVTPEEYTAFSEGGWNFFSQGAEKVKLAELDPMAKGAFAGVKADAEGNVTKDAYMAAVPARFKAADKNGDGVLSRDELNASLQPSG